MASQIITLTTDFGYQDAFVGVMKGVILRINPTVSLVDLTHGVAPQDIMGGAMSLAAAVPYFPPRSVHVAVVDPGVGSARKPIVIETADACYVGPDNGVLSLAARTSRVIDVVETSETYHLKPTSSTFHGRDIFAPVAAHVALGKPTQELGRSLNTFTTIEWPAIEKSGPCLSAQVVYVDHFGNLVGNIRASDLDSSRETLTVSIHGTVIRGISESYSEAGEGNFLAIFNSWGLLEISQCNGNAQRSLGAHVGSAITVNQR